MSQETSPDVSDVVARFFEQRRQGRRASIDEVLASFGELADPQRTRVDALSAIARQAKTAIVSAGSSEDAGDLALGDAWPAGFPELEGYDIVDVIGRGGMGVVYEAYQRSTGRRVAVKVMLTAAARSAAGRRRFEREIELIARLQHPNIVAVIDSGIDKENYFYAMEYVDGRPLDQAPTPGACDPRQALELIATVAEAVDYAHQRGVLHRDLKPSNVMIDERGQVRLLDFGLAKTIDPGAPGGLALSLSEPGQLVGTLAYMSPEQSRGQFEQMSVRSDVYSLGAMAYELLTGELPCDVDGPLPDVLNRIAGRDPDRPSSLRRGLDADIDAILLKALEKSPERRYSTAAEFASDLRRYLAHQPIVARRAGPLTRLTRWVRRNRGAAGVGAAAIVLIIAVTTVAFLRIVAERDRAVELGQQAQRMMGAMQAMLVSGDPDRARGADVTLREKFDEWERGLADYEDQPEMEAGLRAVFGRLAWLHAEYDRAEQNLRRAVALRRAQEGAEAQLSDALFHLARTLHDKSQYAAAERCYREALDIREHLYRTPHADVAESLSGLAWVLKDQDRYEQAETLYRQALEILRSLPADQRVEIADTLQSLAQLLTKRSRYAEAEQRFREALALRRDAFGVEHRHVASTMATLGSLLREIGKLDDAEPLLRDALAMREKLLGDQHPHTIVSMNMLGLLLKDRSQYAEAEQVLRRALELRIKAHGQAAHEHVAVSMHNLAGVLQARGQYAEAERLLLDALEILRQVFGDLDRHHGAAFVWHSLADLYLETGDLERARELCEKALAIRREIYPEQDHFEIGCSLLLLGRITLAAGDPGAAERLLEDTLAIFRAKLCEGHWRIALCESVVGECLTTQERFEDAEQLLASGFEVLNQRADARNRETRAALHRLIDLYERWEKPEQAEAYRALLSPSDDAD